MADDNTKFYALFDGEDIDGKRYAVGEAIDTDAPAAVLTVLKQMGRISDSAPIPDAERPVADMDRVELQRAATDAMQSRMAEASDDDLRRMVQAHRDERDEGKADEPADDTKSEAERQGDAKALGTVVEEKVADAEKRGPGRPRKAD